MAPGGAERERLDQLAEADPDGWFTEIVEPANEAARRFLQREKAAGRAVSSRPTFAELEQRRRQHPPAHVVQAAPGWTPIAIPGRPGWWRHLINGEQVDLPSLSLPASETAGLTTHPKQARRRPGTPNTRRQHTCCNPPHGAVLAIPPGSSSRANWTNRARRDSPRMSTSRRAYRASSASCWTPTGSTRCPLSVRSSDLLYDNTLGRVVGPSGHFKLFVVIDFAGHIGTGTPWHGRYVRQGTVVYLVAEGAEGIRKRVRAWEARTTAYA